MKWEDNIKTTLEKRTIKPSDGSWNALAERMKAAGTDRKKATAESLAMSRELVETAAEHFNGIYFITPFMRYDMIIQLIDDVKKYDLQTNKEEILT